MCSGRISVRSRPGIEFMELAGGASTNLNIAGRPMARDTRQSHEQQIRWR
jgi:hypothetical protein